MTSFRIFAALAAVAQVLAASSSRTTTSVWLPSRTTRAGDHIYASVITAVPEKSSTEYLLACTSVFKSPYPSSCGDFRGVTLTQGPETMRIEFGSDTFTCDSDDDDEVCNINDAAASTLASSDRPFTAITIVSGADKLGKGHKQTTKPASPSATSANQNDDDDNGICKRATGKGGSSGSNGGSDSDSSSSSPKPNGKGGKGCSGAGSLRAELGFMMGVMGALVGVVGFVL
ncbi:hypothetical protein ACHAQA_004974 [Verticillium albo-atrum]